MFIFIDVNHHVKNDAHRVINHVYIPVTILDALRNVVFLVNHAR